MSRYDDALTLSNGARTLREKSILSTNSSAIFENLLVVNYAAALAGNQRRGVAVDIERWPRYICTYQSSSTFHADYVDLEYYS